MAPCRLLLENGRAHFMTQRFDRDSNEKQHVQTLCAMEHMDYKQRATHAYAQAFMAIAKLGLRLEARDELFRRMAFNVMARNCDDHTKNFSFRLRKGHRWELAPAYDVTFAHNPRGEWTNQHLMSVNEKFKDITAADLMAMANRFDVGTPVQLIEQVRAALRRWPEFAAKAGVPSAIVEEIGRQHLMLLPAK